MLLNRKILAFLLSLIITTSFFAPISKGQTLSANNSYAEVEKVIKENLTHIKKSIFSYFKAKNALSVSVFIL